MAAVAVIGEGVRVRGFALAGALVLPADTPAEARAAWRSLPPDVAVAVLTPRVAGWLRDALGEHDPGGTGMAAPLPVVMPA